MTAGKSCRVAILYHGDREARKNAAPEQSRFLKVFQALTALGMHGEPAVYHDDFCDEVRDQLMRVDGVLVWVNPIEGGRDRSVLDAMLREVAASGVFVRCTSRHHPEIGNEGSFVSDPQSRVGMRYALVLEHRSDSSGASFATDRRRSSSPQAIPWQWRKRCVESRACGRCQRRPGSRQRDIIAE